MSHRLCAALSTVALVALAMPLAVSAQPEQPAAPLRTPDGQPDISGVFTFRTLTPLQRPEALEGQDTLNAEDAAAFEAAERRRLNRDTFDPEAGAPSAGYQSPRGRRRPLLQRVLVRAGYRAHQRQADVARRRSPEWANSLYRGVRKGEPPAPAEHA